MTLRRPEEGSNLGFETWDCHLPDIGGIRSLNGIDFGFNKNRLFGNACC
ncbi:hypothetical protein [Echinicola soli]|nr:hypothetical protein [Echinicola soli]